MSIIILRSLNYKGFTLIELLIVVAIIAILAAVALPQFSAYKARAVRSGMLTDSRNIAMGIEVVLNNCSSYEPINGFSAQGPGGVPLIADMSTCPVNSGGSSPLVSITSGNLISIQATSTTWIMTVTNERGNDVNFTGPITRRNDGFCKWANNVDC